MLNPTQYSAALTEAEPSGPNLEYDPEFMALSRAQQGKPEQAMGDTVKPAEEPDWHDVGERAQALLGRTRDLRVGVALCTALLRTDGFEGFAAALSILDGLLKGQWDTVHPQLDAEDDNDPTLRLNSLLSLAAADGLLKALREAPVVASKALGRFSLRDLRIASGKLSAPSSLADPPKQVQIDAAFLDADMAVLQSTARAIGSALDHLTAIEALLIDKVGGQAPVLKPLVLDLRDIKLVLGAKLAALGAAPPGSEAEVVTTGSPNGQVSSREDVVLQLDRLCEYYSRHEPSSPVPLLLRRAKRLVAKDFMDIIRDLTPGGVAEAELLGGVEKKE